MSPEPTGANPEAQPPRKNELLIPPQLRSELKLNVYVVDDQPINIEMMKSQLAGLKLNMTPEFFVRGDLALETIFKLLQLEVEMFKNSNQVIYRRPLDLLLCDF